MNDVLFMGIDGGDRSFATLKLPNLTTNGIPYVGPGGLLTVSPALTFDGTSFNVLGQQRLVTAYSTTPHTLNATSHNSGVFTNEGATALNVINLPTAVANLTYTFVVQDTDGIQIVAFAGDTIRVAGSVSAAAGNIQATVIGTTVTLVAINATEWISIATNGTWTVT